MNRRIFLRTLAGASMAGASAGVACAYGEDTHDLEVTHVPIQLGLRTPLRLVALGDIHFDPAFNVDYLARVMDRVNSLRADLIVYTGDFLTQSHRRLNDLADLLARGRARLGSYGVPGNHDHWVGLPPIVQALETRGGVRILRNEFLPLPGEDAVYLTGIDSIWAGRPDSGIIARTPEHSRHIVFAHEPDPFLQLTDSRVKLQVSGHTHGGQVRVPLIGALVLPKYGKLFQAGLYTDHGRHLYVNRGIGSLTPHIRINCRPEITLFELS
jgi:predicted MPP superfamily phosphohydrolase